MNKSITLIGMAGAGKSTIGRKLAKVLDFNFLDGDAIIEERINKSIQSYLDQHGGKEFTKIEEEVLLSISLDKTVLATGGSAVLSDAAMNFLKKESEVIFLDVSYENISERILNLSERGLVRGPNQSLQDTYNERLSLYKKYADHTVINDGDVDSCLKQLLVLLGSLKS
ncbi:MAG: shikimate kinase [SAR86 cluster bacterium]|jgi:shikimate kinase|nr:shikimate kinase [SAR86 cluster bacterium]|tara:strand:- start:4682 stop:5188 length:507 start_codon:yes stop_codon:yes gene_type:complete